MSRFSNTVSSIALVSAIMLGLSAQAAADQVFPDDVIVQGSICAGFDCVNNENFGADTLRLKENNLRIHFDDTSNSSSFPANDWRIVVNDQTNGGASYFAIEDSSAGRTPFRVLAGAPANSLYVASNGNVGMGTSSPVTQLHLVDGNTPTMRLEQDGSSGFTAQTWDIAGNEANFFIRDVTNGSRLPFRIEPSTPANTMYLASTGNVGLGTTAPSEALHVRGTDGDTTLFVEEASASQNVREMVHLSNNGGSFVTMSNTQTGFKWHLIHENNLPNRFIISNSSVAGNEFALTAEGNLTISGQLTTSGSCSGGCDRVFTPEYDLDSIDQHSALMWESGYLPGVGPTPENGSFNITTKVGGMLNELEHAHIYIAQLNARLTELEGRVAAPSVVE